MTKIIPVAAAAILKNGKYLCTQRAEEKQLGGYWEFPGGKIEAGETPETALIREIKEELSADIKILRYINEAQYTYEFGTVVMKTFEVELISDKITLSEHQNHKWLLPSEFDTLTWAPVDIPAVEILKKSI